MDLQERNDISCGLTDIPSQTIKTDYNFIKKSQSFPCIKIHYKVGLATTELKGIHKAFSLPKDEDKFLKYIKDDPDKLVSRRATSIEGCLVNEFERKKFFVQEFTHNPMLVDGKRSDAAILFILYNKVFSHCFRYLTA